MRPGEYSILNYTGPVEVTGPPRHPSRPLGGRVLTLAAAACVGLLAAAVAVPLGNLPLKPLALVLFILGVAPLAAFTRQPKPMLLIAWILAQTYFRVIFPIESLAGFQGFYVTFADFVFVLLLGYWLVEAAVTGRSRPYGPPVVRFFLPLAVVCFVSALLAQRTDWAMYEVVRVAKVPLILFYCRYNLGPKEWWVCVGALALGVVAQTGLGILQVARIIGNYELEAYEPNLRANGSMGHASMFAGYMLLLSPLFLALALSLRPKFLKMLAALVGLTGFVGIAFTLSRIPWVLTAAECVLLAIGFLALRKVRLKRVIGTGAVAVVALGLMMIPLLNRIQSRFTTDLNTAISWRLKMNEIAIDLFRANSFFGIGLANVPLYLRSYDMEFSDSLDQAMAGVLKRGNEEIPVRGFHWVWVPHNIYLLLLAETGLLGLAAFLLGIFAAFRTAFRNLRVPNRVVQGASLGLLVGICGVLGQMITDWALWLDPVLYTFTLSVALLQNAPAAILGSGAE